MTVDLFEQQERDVIDYVDSDGLESGMKLASKLRVKNGEIVLQKGTHVTGDDIQQLQSARWDGTFIYREEKRWTLTVNPSEAKESLAWMSDVFDGLRSFLIHRDSRGLIESFTELLDLNRVVGDRRLSDSLRTYFDLLKQFEAEHRERRIGLNGGDNESPARQLLDATIRGETIDLDGESFDETSRSLIDFYRLREDLYDQTVEVFGRTEDELRHLSDSIPSREFLESPSEAGREYLLGLRQMDPDELTVTHMLPDLNEDWLTDVLEPPAFDEGDWQFSFITARVKQIIENVLIRGVFMHNAARDLIDLIEEDVAGGDNLYRRLTFPLKDQNYLLSHIVNVLVISNYLANEAGVSREEREELFTAGLLFDIGMLRLNPDLWTRGLKPEEEDVDRIQNHPTYSTEWLKEIDYEFSERTLDAIEHHHERMDGSGYPNEINGENLPVSTRILIIADVYDAMSTSRPHRQAIHPDKILTYLKNRTNKFDPGIVDIVEEKIGPYPPGTVVQLDSNEIGVSLEHSGDPYRPKIKVVIDSAGQVVDDPEQIDLSDQSDKKIVETVGSRNTPNALLKYMT